MSSIADDKFDERILVLMPTAKDAERTCDFLARSQMSGFVCRDLSQLCQEIQKGGGAALLTEEALAGVRVQAILTALRQQPPWSDFPLIILAREVIEGRADGFSSEMNATLIERPLRTRSLISVIQSSLRSRRHQYAVRSHLQEREAHNHMLKRNEARLLFALNAGRLGSWELDLATNNLQCSDICKLNFGRSKADALTYDDLRNCIHPGDQERLRKEIERCTREGSDCDVECRTTWPDGSTHWLLVRGRMADDENSPLRLSGVTLDITSQKETEAELRTAHRRKDEFLALLAHELRNPLAPVRNAVQVLRMSREDGEMFEHASAIMDRQLKQMVRLIDDLLDVSRITQNKMELRRSNVSLADIVAMAVETAHPAIKAAGHELTVSLPASAVYLDADQTRLAQVLANILSNSAKYTTRSGGHIWLSAERGHGQVIISVRDNGIGIPLGSLSSIFDMFSQVDRSIERSTGGLGIGLALVKGLVEMHGGTVTAMSEGLNCGSTFTVYLPVTNSPESKANADDSIPRSVRRKILVTDDNRDSANTMAMMLRLQGHDVRTAYNGQEAVNLAASDPPELILMDIGMPQLNGYETTKLIRKQPRSKDIVIIALTGWGQDADREMSTQVGCDGHLVKPVDSKHLDSVISNLPTRTGRTVTT